MREAVLTNDETEKTPLKHFHTFIKRGSSLFTLYEALSFLPSPAASAKVQLFCKTLKESPGFLQN